MNTKIKVRCEAPTRKLNANVEAKRATLQWHLPDITTRFVEGSCKDTGNPPVEEDSEFYRLVDIELNEEIASLFIDCVGDLFHLLMPVSGEALCHLALLKEQKVIDDFYYADDCPFGRVYVMGLQTNDPLEIRALIDRCSFDFGTGEGVVIKFDEYE